MTTIAHEDLAREYARLAALAAAAPGAGQTRTLGWDLEYTSADSLLAFVDQILYRRLNDFLPDGDSPVILDCGANIGYTSLHYRRLYPEARITAFEPDPQFVPLLRRNLDRNGAGDVAVVAAAAWTADGFAPWIMEGKDGSRLATATTATTVQVPTVDLARYLSGEIDLLKLDVEGAEFAIVPHLARHLDRVKNILVECHLTGPASYEGLSRLLATLTGAGFTISLNSYGPWRDLTRRQVPAPLHAEQYMIAAGWRTESPLVSHVPTYAPYAGVAHEIERQRQADLVTRVVAGVAQNPEHWAVHRMIGRFKHQDGRCFLWRCPAEVALGDSPGATGASTLVLEDDRLLGPAQAIHDDIRSEGGGRYSHWRSEIYFSTSDGSDPNTNGRRYTAVLQK
jgi:FkbM family methyltransferase